MTLACRIEVESSLYRRTARNLELDPATCRAVVESRTMDASRPRTPTCQAWPPRCRVAVIHASSRHCRGGAAKQAASAQPPRRPAATPTRARRRLPRYGVVAAPQIASERDDASERRAAAPAPRPSRAFVADASHGSARLLACTKCCGRRPASRPRQRGPAITRQIVAADTGPGPRHQARHRLRQQPTVEVIDRGGAIKGQQARPLLRQPRRRPVWAASTSTWK
jgi:hypothetical protein